MSLVNIQEESEIQVDQHLLTSARSEISLYLTALSNILQDISQDGDKQGLTPQTIVLIKYIIKLTT